MHQSEIAGLRAQSAGAQGKGLHGQEADKA